MARRDKHTESGGGTAVQEPPRGERSGGESSGSRTPARRGTIGTALAGRGGPGGLATSPWGMMRRMTEDLTDLSTASAWGPERRQPRAGRAPKRD